MNILEARRRTLGKGVYKKTVEGNPAIAQGSLARMYPGITMQGWTEQASYEGNQLYDASLMPTHSAGGATVTNNGDGSFTISGEGALANSFTSYVNLPSDKVEILKNTLKPGNLIFSSERVTRPYAQVRVVSSGNNIEFSNSASPVSRKSLTQEEIDGITGIYYFFYGQNGMDIVPGTIKPMFYQDGDGTWEPYTGGRPSPNPEYPQEIVNAGKYNEDTQKWEYEITIANAQTDPDKNQTVTLTSDRPLTKWDKLEKRNGQWGWVYKSGRYTVTGEEIFTSSNASYHGEQTSDAWLLVDDMFSKVWIPSDGPRGYCEKLSWNQGIWGKDGSVGFTYNENQIHIRLNNADVGITSEDTLTDIANKIKEYVGQQYQEGNPFIFWYETAEETFVPLSASEQEQMNALHTFRPTTVLSNDCDCNMILTYKTKKSLEVTT